MTQTVQFYEQQDHTGDTKIEYGEYWKSSLQDAEASHNACLSTCLFASSSKALTIGLEYPAS
jgi:hypothetical protein